MSKNSTDRISLLPDYLLHDILILSFLNTKHVVQTCVLSKRWKTVWTQIPTLNFDFNSYPFEIEGSSSSENTILKERSFKNFVLSVLAQHSGKHVRNLSYTSSKNDDETILTELLICYARCHKVPKLCINTYYYASFDWKFCFSGYNSLTELKISCYDCDWEALKLPSLKTLEIVEGGAWERQFELEDVVEIPAMWFHVD